MAENSGDVISAVAEVRVLLLDHPHAESISVNRTTLDTLYKAAMDSLDALAANLSEIAVKELLDAISYARTDPVLGALHAGLAKSLLALKGGSAVRRAEDE